jgi:ABC-type uncharacterized transport system permease subunit
MTLSSPNAALYVALALYAAGTLATLLSLVARAPRTQRIALGLMIGGFVAHTFWIGSICVRTHHPPITNLPEAASLLAWTIFAFELVLLLRYRVQAASFFLYPLILILLTVSAIIREPYALIDPTLRSGLFMTHVVMSTVGVASLLIALSFMALSRLQDRALKNKTRGALWEWIPSLNICNVVSYRALSIGFSIYTLGLLTGVVWSYRTTAELMDLRVKPIGAVVAWMLFAVLLQSYISGGYRARRIVFVSAAAFIAIVVAVLGIHHA